MRTDFAFLLVPLVALSSADRLRGESVASSTEVTSPDAESMPSRVLLSHERATEFGISFKSEAQTVGINNNIIRNAKNIIILF